MSDRQEQAGFLVEHSGDPAPAAVDPSPSTVLGDCPLCDKPIHSLDGAVASNGKPFEHMDCKRAASIDYAAAFDTIYHLALDTAEVLHRLSQESAGDEAFQGEYDAWLFNAIAKMQTAGSWATYEDAIHA